MSNVIHEQEQLLASALRFLVAERGDQSNPHLDADQERAADLLALTARDLTRATDLLPPDEQPVGWRSPQGGQS